MYSTILVPTDGSAAAETAVKAALALAERFDASIHVINVTELDDFPADVEPEATEKLIRQGEATLATITDQAAEVGVATTTNVIETTEPIHQAIIDYGTNHDADLIVMGTQGRTGLNRLVLGSVTERMLRVSPIPVLTVHEDTNIDIDFETVLVPTDGSAAGRERKGRTSVLSRSRCPTGTSGNCSSRWRTSTVFRRMVS